MADTNQSVPEGSTEYWRKQATYEIPEYFELLKQKFLNLKFVSMLAEHGIHAH